MTDVSTQAFDASMRGLRAAYLQRLPEQIAKLRQTIPIAGSADERHRVECLHRAVNVTSLIDTLEVRFSDALPEPFRVLLVEDDESLAAVYARALRLAGMVVSVVSDPFTIVGPLAELRPDVILMDMYLPGCTGGELAMVIRQEPAWIGVPILYLSSERDRVRPLDALRCGGDVFLTKPIDPARLVSEVTARGQRMRMLQARLSHDGLTGLLNHAAIRGELERELVRARRDRTPLTIAILDIDGFKAINDTFGHPAGDRVLKNLSSMLRRRLRRSDLMGRYGGDEMMVILPVTPLDQATTALDALRGAFAQVRHGADDVFAAFTAGLAMMGPLGDASALIAEADRALCVGKRAGKNRCQAADSSSP